MYSAPPRDVPELVAGDVVLPSENDIVRAFPLREPNRRGGQVPAVFLASVKPAVSAVALAECSPQADSAPGVAERVGVLLQLALRLASDRIPGSRSTRSSI